MVFLRTRAVERLNPAGYLPASGRQSRRAICSVMGAGGPSVDVIGAVDCRWVDILVFVDMPPGSRCDALLSDKPEVCYQY